MAIIFGDFKSNLIPTLYSSVGVIQSTHFTISIYRSKILGDLLKCNYCYDLNLMKRVMKILWEDRRGQKKGEGRRLKGEREWRKGKGVWKLR